MRKLISGLILTMYFNFGIEANACESIPDGLSQLLKPGSVIFVGETHGTAQMPESFYDVVCNASELGHSVDIALEFSSDMTAQYQRFLKADQDAYMDAKDAILNSDFWTLDLEHQDGRRSIAAFNLLENLRTLYVANSDINPNSSSNINVFGFDEPVDDFQQRDRKMAEQILTRVGQDNIVLVHTGRRHSLLEHGTPWDPEVGNAAAYLKEKYSEVESIRLLHIGGNAWVCKGSCGVKEIERTASNVEGAALFYKSDGSDKHSWNWNIGAIEASLPQLTISKSND